jgi:hypothetical protein
LGHRRRAAQDRLASLSAVRFAGPSVFGFRRTNYREAKAYFSDHLTVRHSAYEYVRGKVHTNTIEGYFSIFKRGMKGVYQHCSEKHLHRYLAEFDFRYNNRIALGVNDPDRTIAAIAGPEGKCLTYRQPY